jgi:hypothetical protein
MARFTVEITVTPDDGRVPDENDHSATGTLAERLEEALAFSTARDALEEALRASVELRLVSEERG